MSLPQRLPREFPDWPNAAASRRVDAGGLSWHVQRFGSGPVLLLVHGTAAATHSWRDLAPLLAAHFCVIAPDLPGHGFTSAPPFAGYSLPAMAQALSALLAALGAAPAMAVGHSAGAAILARMALDGAIAPRVLVSLNGALLPLTGIPGRLFSPLARAVARSAFVPRLVAHRAREGATIERLLSDTGSHLDAEGVGLYTALAQRPAHVAAALAMMANWDLRPLVRDLPGLRTPLVLVTSERDRTIAPAQAGRVRALLPAARTVSLGPYGHLVHEERPVETAQLLTDVAVASGVLAGA